MKVIIALALVTLCVSQQAPSPQQQIDELKQKQAQQLKELQDQQAKQLEDLQQALDVQQQQQQQEQQAQAAQQELQHQQEQQKLLSAKQQQQQQPPQPQVQPPPQPQVQQELVPKAKAKPQKKVTNLVQSDHPMPGKVVDLTDKNFKTFMNGDRPALILFYATWCPHCKSFKPEFEKVAKDVGSDYLIGRVDGETYGDLADDFDISGYPTIKLLRKEAQSAPDFAKKSEEYESSMNAGAVEQWLKSSAGGTQGSVHHLEMLHLHPDLERLMAVQGRCYRSERALYEGH